MSWSGFQEAEERGLELSLGLPGYFSKAPAQAGLKEKGGSGGAPGSKARPSVTPVVGWPPVRSFRRNLTSSSKPSLPSYNGGSKEDDDMKAKPEHGQKGLFVKINMDGVPIGRKVELTALGSYDKLSAAVDQLFRGLLAAQMDQSCTGEKHAAITGLLDGSGEYTLVYEDDEGDRMLAGDVPWDMFITTAKRLRVLKSSDLSASSLTTSSRKRAASEC